MRIVIQRVSRAAVRVGGETVASIGPGMLLLVGIERGDTSDRVLRAARKVSGLRILEDGEGRLNRSLSDVGGAILAVSQFTLAGSLARGKRPSFDRAMPAVEAKPFFDAFVAALEAEGVSVETGVFGAMMEVELVNDGPVTLIWEERDD